MPRFCSSKRAAEFAADRLRHFVGHEVETRRKAMAGTQRAGDQLQRIGQLLGELSQSPAALNSSHKSGRNASQDRQRWDDGRTESGERAATAPADAQAAALTAKNLAGVSVVSACSNNRLQIAKPVDELRQSAPAFAVQRLRKHAALP